MNISTIGWVSSAVVAGIAVLLGAFPLYKKVKDSLAVTRKKAGKTVATFLGIFVVIIVASAGLTKVIYDIASKKYVNVPNLVAEDESELLTFGKARRRVEEAGLVLYSGYHNENEIISFQIPPAGTIVELNSTVYVCKEDFFAEHEKPNELISIEVEEEKKEISIWYCGTKWPWGWYGWMYKKNENRHIFEGTCKRSKLIGLGKQYYDSYDIPQLVYFGEFRDGIYHGEGKLYKGDYSPYLAYSGSFRNGVYSGFGKEYSKDGVLRYIGDFKRGKYSGTGKQYAPNGFIVHAGKFRNGQSIGESDTILLQYEFYDSGVIKYVGEISSGKYNGLGKLYSEDGYVDWFGEFLDGKKAGKGLAYKLETYKNKDGETISEPFLTYNGELAEGKFDGYAYSYSWDKGKQEPFTVYSGEYRQGKREGYGALYYADYEKRYEGFWRSDYYYGQGKQYFKDSGAYISSMFIDGKWIGAGEFHPTNGYVIRIDDCTLWEYWTYSYTGSENNAGHYVGEISDGKRHGKGFLYYCNEDGTPKGYYEGDWRNGVRDGEGVEYTYDELYSFQGHYDGYWSEDKYNGQGTYYYYDWCYYKNVWEDGIPTLPIEIFDEAGNPCGHADRH